MAIGYQPPRIVHEGDPGVPTDPEMLEPIDEQELESLIGSEIARAVLHDGGGESERRSKALRYVQGELPDFPAKKGRSSYTSRETADTIGWILPGLMRVFAGSSRALNFLPVGPDDEDMAEQASDYVNYQFFNKNDGYHVLRDACYDSLLHSYGVIKQYWNDYPEASIARLTGVTEEQISILEANGCQVLTAAPGEPQQAVDPNSGQPIMLETFEIKIQHQSPSGHVCYEVIPGEDFIRDPAATSLANARFVGQRSEKTRSELVEMGFDINDVYDLPAYSATSTFNDEKMARDVDGDIFGEGHLHKSMEKVELFEVFIKVDVDGDGVAESVRAYYAGGGGAGKLLYAEEWDDEWPFDLIRCNPMPHRVEGKSTFTDVEDIQQINSILTRQLLDNLYATNVPMLEAEEGSVLNPEMLMAPKFGAVIWRKKGTMGTAPVTPVNIPFVGEKIVAALELFSDVVEKRTGVSRATMALDPSAYQNQTATSAQLQQQASYSKIELIARDMAEDFKSVFRKSLRIMVKNQDRKEMVRLRGKWIEMDPAWWNADMDCEVNVGLGTGTQERDIAQLGNIYQTQLAMSEFLKAAGNLNEAVAMTPKIVRTVTRMAQASGLRDASGYYPDLTEKDIPRLVETANQAASQPPIELQVVQAQSEAAQQIEQIKGQTQAQTEQAKAQVEMQKMQAESQAKQQEIQFTLQKELAADERRMQVEANKELAQLQADLKTQAAERALKLEIEELKGELEAWRTRTVETNKWDIAVLNAGAKQNEDGGVEDKGDARHRESTEALAGLADMITRMAGARKRAVSSDGREYVSEVGPDGVRRVKTPSGRQYTIETE